MASYDGHATKRQRTDTDGYGVQAGKRDKFEDPHKPSASPVVHVRGLAEPASESDLMSALNNFGHINYVMILHGKRQALVEFEDISHAVNLVQYAESAPVYVGGRQAHFNYSTSQKISRPPGHDDQPNKVLLFSIANPKYPITVEVLHTICSPSGSVNRIVIFRKNGLQAMVEFENLESAQRAKQSLNGADIYSGCCTLKIEYAKPTRLNVNRNDHESFDYTVGNVKSEYQSPKAAPLLQEPRYGSGPTPFESRNGGRNVPPPHNPPSAMDYTESYEGYSRSAERYPPPPPAMDPYSSPPGRHDPYSVRGGPGDGYGGHPPPGAGPYADAGGQGPPGLYQQGSVIMVYGLNAPKMNCQRVFNLFCLYGNVVRVKFLKTKEGTAMVQMGDSASCDRAMKNLNHCYAFDSKLQIGMSKQAFLQDVNNPHELPDGSPSFVDFMGSRNNRFTNPDAAAKNRINPPFKTVHYFNAPANLTEEQIRQLFVDADTQPPTKVKIFPSKSEKSSTGLMEWETKSEATEGVILVNHTPIENPGSKSPYVFKMCYSASAIVERPPGNRM